MANLVLYCFSRSCLQSCHVTEVVVGVVVAVVLAEAYFEVVDSGSPLEV